MYLSHYIEESAFPGTSEITYAFIGGLGISQITFIGPLVTLSTRELGTHVTLAIGLVLETAGLVTSGFATKVWHLFLTQGLLFGWGSGFLYVGSISIIPQWFSKRRSLASAIAAGGSGLGGLCYSLGFQAMITRFGYHWCFRISAAIAFTVNAVCVALMRDRNAYVKPNQKSFDISILKQYRFVLVLTWSWLSALGYTIILFSLPDNAFKLGLTLKQGSIVAAVANLGMAIGRPIVGYFSDHLGRVNMVVVVTGLCALFCFAIWMPALNYGVLLTFAFLGGTTFGTFYAVSFPTKFYTTILLTVAQVIATLAAECFGVDQVPAVLSIVWTMIVVPTTCELLPPTSLAFD